MVGDAAQQGKARDILQIGDLGIRAAFARQFVANEQHTGIVDTVGEVQQDAVRAEIGQAFRLEVGDRREVAVAQQACPMVVRSHLHAPFVLPHRRGRVVGRLVIIFAMKFDFRLALFLRATERSENPAQRIHGQAVPTCVPETASDGSW